MDLIKGLEVSAFCKMLSNRDLFSAKQESRKFLGLRGTLWKPQNQWVI